MGTNRVAQAVRNSININANGEYNFCFSVPKVYSSIIVIMTPFSFISVISFAHIAKWRINGPGGSTVAKSNSRHPTTSTATTTENAAQRSNSNHFTSTDQQRIAIIAIES